MPPASTPARIGPQRGRALTVAALLAMTGCASGTTAAPSPDAAPVSSAPPTARAEPVEYRVEVLNRYPHDENAWTQGLEFHDGLLLESTGRLGLSTLRLVNPRTGEPETLIDVDPDLYAEGVTVVGDRALQITWTEETLLVTDLDPDPDADIDPDPDPDPDPAFEPDDVTRIDDAYDGEGWGLCHNGARLVMSDGSDQLWFRDPDTFEVTGRVAVTLRGEPLARLNELECVDGSVWANVWLTTTIVRIDPSTGEVDAVVDGSDLVPDDLIDLPDAVLNGIAHDPATGHFWLTGKLWPVMYEVTLTPVD